MKKIAFRTYAYVTVTCIGIGAACFLGVKYVLPALLPFLLAWGIVLVTRPCAVYLQKKCHLPERIGREVISLSVLTLIFGGFSWLSARLIAEGWRLFTEGTNNRGWTDVFDFLIDPFGCLFGTEEGSEALKERINEAFGSLLTTVAGQLTSWIPTLVNAVPKLFLFLTVSVISTIYIAWDVEGLHSSILSLCSDTLARQLRNIKSNLLSTVFPYVRSYAVLMALTFAVMTFGLVLLGVEYAILLAVVIALLDALPVIGVGTVLIPWSVFEWIFGDVKLGTGLVVLYAIHEIIRQLAEPRIVGKTLGIPPLLTLVLLYAGYSLFGLVGLILLPVITVLVRAVRPPKEKERTVTSHAQKQP